MVEINHLEVNVAAILAAAAVNLVLGFAWYAAIFVKPWTKQMGYDAAVRPSRRTMAKGAALLAVGNLLFVWVLAFYLAGWRFIPGAAQLGPLPFALNSALSLWIGFFLPVHLARVVWEKQSWTLFLINGGYHLVAAALAAVILAHWTG